ncbi:MAG: hypothetical protein HKM24_01790 [Gammaproteobacteria bacterium]|nr:hypothetical protein [Gammaproteobacteria bacterium]
MAGDNLSNASGGFFSRLMQILPGRSGAAEHDIEDIEDEEGNADALSNLYWNRAELKRELSKIKKENDKLGEELEKQRSETERVSELMSGLERRIGTPEYGFSAIVHFQLRNLWNECHEQLNKFSEDLAQQQEDRERKKMIMDFNQQRDDKLQKIDIEVAKTKDRVDTEKQSLEDMESRNKGLRGLFSFFKRREYKPALESQREIYSQARDDLERLFELRMKTEGEPWPEYPGMDIKGKRVINIAIISLAQYLYLHFYEFSIAQMARTSQLKSIFDVSYGSHEDCTGLMKRIRKAKKNMFADDSYGEELKKRAKVLRKKVQYRADEDTIPMASSLSSIPAVQGTAAAKFGSVEVNILADDYWDLLKVLVR